MIRSPASPPETASICSAIDADASTLANDAFSFVGNAGFSSTAGELRWFLSGGNTFIAGDVDGDGAADFQIRLSGTPTLGAGDFVL